jgi:Flp pilus assembly protein TadB
VARVTLDFALTAALGAVIGMGVFLLVLSIVGTRPRDPGKPPLFRRRRVNPRRTTMRASAAVVTGLAVLVLTHWIVLAVAVGLLAGFWGSVFGGTREERNGILRLDALASWTESLRDTIAGAVGLEQAIPATAATSSPLIRPSLNLLVDRLRIREPLPNALQRFADDFSDPSADLVVAALILNSRLRGPGLREVLTALASAAREELDVRRRIEAARRSTRRSVQIVVAVTLGVAALLIVLNHTYVQPYNSFVGQIFLSISIGLFAAGVFWLRRLAHIPMPERFLTSNSVSRVQPAAPPRSTAAPTPGRAT